MYAPGATLDPACAPTDSNCGVQSNTAVGTLGQVPYYAAAGNLLAATSTMTILSNGNVGLGTTNPLSLFSVGSGSGFQVDNTGTVISGTWAGNFASISTAMSSGYDIATWGDSLTAGTGGTPYPTQLSTVLGGRNIFNAGVGGYTSAQILNTFQTDIAADSAKLKYNHIIWAGRNDIGVVDKSVTEANIAAIVSVIPTPQKYVVLSVLNNNAEPRGSANYTSIASLNADLSATYGSHYLDIRSYLISQYNPAIPQDVTDYDNDVVPSSIRSDSIHLNTAGYALVANYLASHASAWGENQQLISQIGLAATLKNPTPIGTVTPNVGLFSQIGAGFTSSKVSLLSSTTPLMILGPVGTGDQETMILSAGGAGGNDGPSIGFGNRYSNGADVYPNWRTASISSQYDGLGGLGGLLSFKVNNGSGSQTNLIEAMRIIHNGYVGIGTASPSGPFQVNAGSSAFLTVLANGNVGIDTATPSDKFQVFATTTGNGIRIDGPASAGSTQHLQFGWTGGFAGKIESLTKNGGGGSLLFYPASDGTTQKEAMRIDSMGNVGIGTTSPFATLSVHANNGGTNTTLFAIASSTASATTTLFSIANTGDVTIKGSGGGTCTIGNGSGATSCTSDERLKTNIALIVDPLKGIEQLRGVTFNWKDPTKNQQQFIGVIAQDVQKVFPQAVVTNADGYLAVDYAVLVAPLIEAVKELAGKVNTLAATVAGFANRVDTKTLCLTDNSGSTCYTRSQLNSILNQGGQQSNFVTGDTSSPITITDVPLPDITPDTASTTPVTSGETSSSTPVISDTVASTTPAE